MNKNKPVIRKMAALILCVVMCFGVFTGCETTTENVRNIVIASSEVKTSYEIGEDISYAGLKVQAKLGTGFYKDLNESDYEIATDFNNKLPGDYTVAVSLKGNASFKSEYKVTVKETAAVSLAVVAPLTKQIYEIGEDIDYTGLVLEKTVSTLAKVTVSLEDCYISTDYNSKAPGVYTVNLLLKENSAIKTVFTVSVIAAHAEEIILNTDNVVKSYSVNEEINLSGLVVSQKMSDGNILGLNEADYTVTSDYNKLLGGTYIVTVTSKANSELFATFEVSVIAKAASLEITSPATKLEYQRNESISYTGLSVSKVFDDGTKTLLSEDDYVIKTDFNKALGGTYTVTIALKGDDAIKTTYQVAVIKKLSSISVKTKPIKSTYQVGDELDLSGLVIQKSYNDNTKEEIAASDYTLDTSKYNKQKGGTYRINVTLKEDAAKTTYFSVTVEKQIVSCEYDGVSSPKKTVYELNEEIDLLNDVTGLKLVLTYNDGTIADATKYAYKHTTNFVKGVAGTYFVTISFKLDTYPSYAPVESFSYTYNVTVRNPILSGLRVSKYPTKSLYLNGEAFSSDGLKIEKVFSDGSAQSITSSDYVVETAFDSYVNGVHKVKVSLKENADIFTEFSVTVNPQVSPISFETSLKNNAEILGSIYTFDFTAKDSLGNKINNVKAQIDGNAKIDINWDDAEKSSYTVNLNNSVQNYKIIFTATDDEGNVLSKEINITHPPVSKGDVIGKITFSVEAFTIGHGYIIAPTIMNIYEGENSVYSLARIIRSNGYCFTYTGSIESGFYIQRIISGTKHEIRNCACKELSSTMPIFNPKNLMLSINPPQKIVDEIGELDVESYTQGSLGEFDLSFMAGWMYAVNNVFPNVGFADCYPMDGDVIRAQFSLAFGSDIGGGWGGGYFGEIDKDDITKLFAKVYALSNEQKAQLTNEFNAALEKVSAFGIAQEELDNAYLALNEAYLKAVAANNG